MLSTSRLAGRAAGGKQEQAQGEQPARRLRCKGRRVQGPGGGDYSSDPDALPWLSRTPRRARAASWALTSSASGVSSGHCPVGQRCLRKGQPAGLRKRVQSRSQRSDVTRAVQKWQAPGTAARR